MEIILRTIYGELKPVASSGNKIRKLSDSLERSERFYDKKEGAFDRQKTFAFLVSFTRRHLELASDEEARAMVRSCATPTEAMERIMRAEGPEQFAIFKQETGEQAEISSQPTKDWNRLQLALVIYYSSHGMSLASVDYFLHKRYDEASERTIEEIRQEIERCPTYNKRSKRWHLKGTDGLLIRMLGMGADYYWNDFVRSMSFSEEEKEYLTRTSELDEITDYMALAGKVTDPERAYAYTQAAPKQHSEPEGSLGMTSLQSTLPEKGSIPAFAPPHGDSSMSAFAGYNYGGPLNQGKGKEPAPREPLQRPEKDFNGWTQDEIEILLDAMAKRRTVIQVDALFPNRRPGEATAHWHKVLSKQSDYKWVKEGRKKNRRPIVAPQKNRFTSEVDAEIICLCGWNVAWTDIDEEREEYGPNATNTRWVGVLEEKNQPAAERRQRKKKEERESRRNMEKQAGARQGLNPNTAPTSDRHGQKGRERSPDDDKQGEGGRRRV